MALLLGTVVVVVLWARPLCVLALLLGTVVVVSWARPLWVLALLLGTVVVVSAFSFSCPVEILESDASPIPNPAVSIKFL